MHSITKLRLNSSWSQFAFHCILNKTDNWRIFNALNSVKKKGGGGIIKIKYTTYRIWYTQEFCLSK